MAIINLGKTFGGGANQGFNEFAYNAHDILNNPFVTRSTTQFKFYIDANNYNLFTGTGFTYDINGNPTGGTVTAYQLVQAGVTEFDLTGGSISLVSLFTAALNSDNFQFNSLLASGNDTVNGTALDDKIQGGTNAGADTINGFGGNDYIHAGTGADTLNGGDGADFLVGDSGNDIINGGDGAGTTYNYDTVGYSDEYLFWGGTQGIYANLSNVTHGIVLAGTATDAFGSTDTLTGIEEILGTGFADTIYARNLTGQQDNTFSMTGFAGNDTLVGTATGRDQIDYHQDEWFAHTSDQRLGTSLVATLHGITVNFAADANGADGADGTITDSFGGTDTVSGIDQVMGTAFADTFNGGAADETFFGWKGNDIINGGGGFDVAAYYRDQYGTDYTVGGLAGITANFSADVTNDGVSHGTVVDGFGTTDTLTNIEAINGTWLNDVMTAGADGMNFWGGDGNDTLTGGAGNDWLDGGNNNNAGEVDTMAGGAGDDGYLVDNVNDIVTELANGGRDRVSTTLNTYSLITHVNIENLEFRGTGNFVGIGSSVDNDIQGGAGTDNITGGAGNDYIVGGAGADILDGGPGASVQDNNDTLGYNNEFMWMGGTQGVTVNLSASTQGGVLSNHAIDSFGTIDTLSGFESVNGTGFADTVYAADLSANNNQFEFRGYLGNDIFVGTAAGRDSIIYKDDERFAQDYADSGHGTLTPTGITVNFTSDVTQGNGSSGTVLDSFGGTDTVSGVDKVKGTFFVDTFNGGVDNDTFLGLKGNDIINGGGGFDISAYYDDENGNGVQNGGGAGITANFSADATNDGVSHGTVVDGFGTADTLTNIEAIDGTRFNDVMTAGADGMEFWAGEGNDTLTGGAGNDWLDGGNNNNAGEVDTMAGGAGDDGYLVDNVNDIVTELANGGRDRVSTTLNTYSLITHVNIENLEFRGTGNFVGIGSSVDNDIQGGAGTDNIMGGAGNDYIVGGAGADTLDGGPGVSVQNNSDTLGYNNEFMWMGGTQGVTVNLSASTQGGVLSNHAIDSFGTIDTLSGFESINGTGFADTVYAANLSANNNQFEFRGYLGNDTFVGSATGFDRIVYKDDARFAQDYADSGHGTITPTGITVNFSSDVTQGNGSSGTVLDSFGGTDTVSGVDEVRGTFFVDTFNGGVDNETFLGLKGNDIINGGGGFDISAYYDDENGNGVQNGGGAGITANFSADVTNDGVSHGTVVDGFGTTDTLTNIEAIDGTRFNDVMTAGADGMNFWGNDGNDTLTGGAGIDTLDGGNGTDSVSYAGSAAGVTVNLSLATAQVSTGNASGDVLISIENLIGSGLADTLTGNGSANTLDGAGGADALIGGLGNDNLTGGLGNDRFIFNASELAAGQADTITDYTRDVAGVGDTIALVGISAANVSVSAASVISYGNGTITDTVALNAPGLNQIVVRGYTDLAHAMAGNIAGGFVLVTEANNQAAHTWSTITDNYDAAGNLANRTTVNDDNTRVVASYDNAGQTWSSIVDAFNAGNALTSKTTNLDDGSHQVQYYDTAANPWSSIVDQFNIAGLLYAETTNFDTGARDTLYIDRNNQTWSTITDQFNTSGLLYAETTNYDVGGRQVLYLDRTNQAWTTILDQFNTSGNLYAETTIFDAGGRQVKYLDQTNQIWATIDDIFDNQNRLTSELTTLDNGNHTQSVFDVNNAFAWKQDVLVYDPTYHVTQHYQVLDDNSIIYL